MFDDDDEPSRADGPLPPDDRLWRHPSEVGAARAASAAPSPPSSLPTNSPGRMWILALVAGMTGAAVALATMAVTGTFPNGRVERQATIRPVSVTTALDMQRAKTVRTLVVDTAAVLTQVDVMAGSTHRHGSGVVVRTDGIVLTSAALVRSARTITITLDDGRQGVAELVGVDETTGLAVVKAPWTGLTVPRIDGNLPEPGDQAVIVAGPPSAGEEPWVSPGVVSSVNHNATSGSHSLAGLIQTSNPVPDAADGAALVSDDGAVRGLALAVGSADDPTAGYAIPIHVASSVADDLLAYGKARKTWLGVEGDDLAMSDPRFTKVGGGAVLSKVTDGSPAAAGGLAVSDVVVSVDGRTVRSMSELIGLLPLHRPGDRVDLVVLRGERSLTVTVTLGQRG